MAEQLEKEARERYLRRMAIELACKLPEDVDDARRVLTLAGQLFEGFLTVTQTTTSADVVPLPREAS